jgi:hypothetical protein
MACLNHTCTLSFTFRSGQVAANVARVLQVDREIQETKVSKSFEVTSNVLKIDIRSSELKILRVVASSLYDMMSVVLQTMDEFDLST